MKTAEEYFSQHCKYDGNQLKAMINAMKEYARDVAKNSLEDAAERAQITFFLPEHDSLRNTNKILITSTEILTP